MGYYNIGTAFISWMNEKVGLNGKLPSPLSSKSSPTLPSPQSSKSSPSQVGEGSSRQLQVGSAFEVKEGLHYERQKQEFLLQTMAGQHKHPSKVHG